MKTIKIVGIVALFLAAIVIIYLLVKGLISDKKTGVLNSKIKASAKLLGIPDALASKIADADDSAAAAKKVGISTRVANIIANGRVSDFSKAQLFAMQGLPLTNDYGVTTCNGFSQGQPVSYSGPCTQVDANNGWTTVTQ